MVCLRHNRRLCGIQCLVRNGLGDDLKKIAGIAVLICWMTLLLAGCRFIRIEEGERTPLEYSIAKQEEIPSEAAELMDQKKKQEFQMTYQVEDTLYLMKGYGQQMTGGYSIFVEEVSESENGVFCKTRLIGPSDGAQGGEPSYPCIVLKIKNTEKPVQFE